MNAQRGNISIGICMLLALSISATRFIAARSDISPPERSEPEACSLLTTADASKALEVSSVSGKRIVASDPKGCVWSNDPAVSDTSRRVVLVTHSLVSFRAANRPAIATIKIEPVSGIGDEAFYQLYPSGGPFIWVRKGNTAISIRILTRGNPRPFTDEQDNAKEVVLAEAAVAKL